MGNPILVEPAGDPTTVVLPTRRTLVKRATLDFGSINAATGAELTVTVPGAVVGDHVSVSSAAAAGVTAGIILQGFVSAANTVKIRAVNITAGAVDPASQAFNVCVHKV